MTQILKDSRREGCHKDGTAPSKTFLLFFFYLLTVKLRLGFKALESWIQSTELTKCLSTSIISPLPLFTLPHAVPLSLLPFLVLTLPPSQTCLKDLPSSLTLSVRGRDDKSLSIQLSSWSSFNSMGFLPSLWPQLHF